MLRNCSRSRCSLLRRCRGTCSPGRGCSRRRYRGSSPIRNRCRRFRRISTRNFSCNRCWFIRHYLFHLRRQKQLRKKRHFPCLPRINECRRCSCFGIGVRSSLTNRLSNIYSNCNRSLRSLSSRGFPRL